MITNQLNEENHRIFVNLLRKWQIMRLTFQSDCEIKSKLYII